MPTAGTVRRPAPGPHDREEDSAILPSQPAPASTGPAAQSVDYESTALERSHYITAIIHLYRGEISRANTWRMRLDQTTNWSIFATASVMGFAFGNPNASHFSLLFADLLLTVFLVLEARRFRFFDVWRARIRKIEMNFFAPILERRLQSPQEDWMFLVSRDLQEPHFHVTRLQAVRQRLLRNYWPIYALVLFAWVIKLLTSPSTAESLAEIYRRCSVGPLPGWVTLASVFLFHASLLALIGLGRGLRGNDQWDIGEVVGEEET